jgi:hypothetical protein
MEAARQALKKLNVFAQMVPKDSIRLDLTANIARVGVNYHFQARWSRSTDLC